METERMAKGMKTGGRRPGSPNKATREREAAIAASGLTPLEYMIRLMRDESLDTGTRLDAAKSAAPYVHAKLAQISLSGPNGGPLQVEQTVRDELMARILGQLRHKNDEGPDA
jgi:hypothetical protein